MRQFGYKSVYFINRWNINNKPIVFSTPIIIDVKSTDNGIMVTSNYMNGCGNNIEEAIDSMFNKSHYTIKEIV